MIKSYFLYFLLIGIYLTIGYSYEENLMKLQRVKRAGPSNTTATVSSTPTSSPMVNITLNRSSIYIVTNYTSLAVSIQTTQSTNQTSSIVTVSLTTTTTTRVGTTSNIVSLYNPDSCQISGYIKLLNNTCVTKLQAQTIASGILRNTLMNTTNAVYALSLYMSSVTNSTTLSNITNTLTMTEIDDALDDLSDMNITINSNTSFVTTQDPQRDDNTIVLGASFKRGIGGEIIDSSNKDNITNSFFSAAAIITEQSLIDVVSLNLLIIDKPTGYENADTSNKKILASSVIVANLRRNSSTYAPMSISLYYNPLEEYKRTGNGTYLCSFFDTIQSQWSETGCSAAYYNHMYYRYECNCSHLTSFALIWLPQSISSTTNYTKNFDAQDIASLIFQCISIICFLTIMMHAICIRMLDPVQRLQTLRLLPMISTASTTILFLFFIALSITVYTQTSSSNQTECFLSSSILMFITYFFLIFMFCVKTSAGYFYYLRFVRLFPHPSHQQLLIMLIISFVISLICVIIAIGLNANSNFNITRLYPYQLCWFTRDVIYYFLTIPIGIFLLLNIITITLVSRSIITHAFHGGTSEQIHERLKRCVIVLLSSCVTQGLAWLFGPFISFLNPIAGNILAWFFIILNGLEGFWSIVLYLLIRLQHLDEQKHVSATMKLSKPTEKLSKEEKKNGYRTNSVRPMEKDFERDQFYAFNDLRKREMDFVNNNDDRVFH